MLQVAWRGWAGPGMVRQGWAGPGRHCLCRSFTENGLQGSRLLLEMVQSGTKHRRPDKEGSWVRRRSNQETVLEVLQTRANLVDQDTFALAVGAHLVDALSLLAGYVGAVFERAGGLVAAGR